MELQINVFDVLEIMENERLLGLEIQLHLREVLGDTVSDFNDILAAENFKNECIKGFVIMKCNHIENPDFEIFIREL